jgi:phosphoribosylanthranilate isomerase
MQVPENAMPIAGGRFRSTRRKGLFWIMRFLEIGDRPRVKICGLTSGENARAVVEAGADAIGVNFWPGSQRFVPMAAASSWLGELGGVVCRVGLFVNATCKEIAEAVDVGVLDALQLHGEESPELVAEVKTFGLPVIKAVGVDREPPVAAVRAFATRFILLDTHAPVEKGGTGRTFRWDLFRDTADEFQDRFFILAGGLTPENAALAMVEARPHAVDVAGGVESAPGVKDPEKVRALVRAVRDG